MITARRRMLVVHGERFEVAPEWVSQLAAIGLAANTAWSASPPGKVISASATSTCSVVTLVNGEANGEAAKRTNGDTLYIKQARYPLKRRLKTWLRPAKTTVEAFAYGCLRNLGIPTLEPVALAESRFLGLLRASLIVTKGIPESIDLLEFAQRVWPTLQPAEQRRIYTEITSQLASQLRKAHAFGFVHHDLKWRNVLLHKPAHHWVPVWIDSPRADVWGAHRRQRLRVIDLSDLARMSVAVTSVYDRARFLRNYLGRERRPGELKRLFRQVADRVQRRIDRDASSGRVQV